ncbi:MAG: translation initiation inhibitor [Betaproteobacteria bacterium RIFCSPLOWO2_02_FULL_67_26]|nr:MAG: translation initiation inhibitor [Betaproteobacteria bacterium RIFCSPLOWO2_02_FULL_67_26]
MSKNQFINPPGLPRPGTYTPVVATSGGRTIYVSGQVPVNEKGELVGKGNLAAQAEQVFHNIDAALKGAGATFADVVKITTFIVGYKPEHRALMHQVRSRYVSKDNPPASTLLGVQSLAIADYLIEVEAVAVAD